MSSALERNQSRSECMAGRSRKCMRTRVIPQRGRIRNDQSGFRIYLGQTCIYRHEDLLISDRSFCVAASTATQLRPHYASSHPRYSQGGVVAWSRRYPNDRDLSPNRSISKAGDSGDSITARLASWPVQSAGSADRFPRRSAIMQSEASLICRPRCYFTVVALHNPALRIRQSERASKGGN